MIVKGRIGGERGDSSLAVGGRLRDAEMGLARCRVAPGRLGDPSLPLPLPLRLASASGR